MYCNSRVNPAILTAILQAQSAFLADSVAPAVWQQALRQLLPLAPARGGLLASLRDDGALGILAISEGPQLSQPAALAPLQLPCEDWQRLHRCQPCWVSLDQLQALNQPALAWLAAQAGTRWLALPLHRENHLEGIALLAVQEHDLLPLQLDELAPLLATLAQLLVFQRQKAASAAEQASQRRQQMALTTLYRITELTGDDDLALMQAALQLGVDYFGLPFGAIGQITAQDYRVVATYLDGQTPQLAAHYPLAETYCQLTLETNDVFSVSAMGSSRWSQAPCYRRFGLEAYIGVPLRVAGQRYGTLSFSSPQVYSRLFDEIDVGFLRLVARWVETALERQQARSERKRLHERFQKIGQEVPGLIFQTRMNLDGSSAYLYASAGIEDIYGLQPEDVANDASRVLAVVHPDDLPAVVASYMQALETLSHWDTIYRVNHPVKGEIWVEGHAKPERTPEGDTIWYGIATDVTAQKQVQLQLEHAKQAAEAANQAKSQFLANMSHEIRTPINGVLGMTRLLLDTELSPQQREYADTVRYSGDVLLSVINDILDFSKIEAGHLALEQIDFELATVLHELGSMMALRIREKGLHYQAELAPGVPARLRGDPGRLRQVLLNLVGNAVKFTDTGGVQLSISVASQSASHCTLQFSVRDSGIGIPAEKIPQLFNRFSQLDESTSRRYGGTGLGLAICQQLVTLMGGEIRASSQPGQGAEFSFTLPLQVADPASAQPAPRVPQAANGQHYRVLLAEDNPVNQRVAVKMLENLGCSVHTANNGLHALSALARQDFDIVFMDLQMPEMDGIEATRAIRAGDAEVRDPAIAIVALTANALADEKARCFAVGMNDFLVKPIQPEALAGALRQWGTAP